MEVKKAHRSTILYQYFTRNGQSPHVNRPYTLHRNISQVTSQDLFPGAQMYWVQYLS